MKKKLVTVNTSGLINELVGGICGPILTPTLISINTIYAMISNGKKVYEVNPSNRKQTILLTKSNYKTDNFNTFDTSSITAKLAEEAKRKEEARLAAITAQEEAERIAKEKAEKASAIVQEENPDIIPVHIIAEEPVSEEPVVNETSDDKTDEMISRVASNVEGFDISRNNKKNKKHGDFRK